MVKLSVIIVNYNVQYFLENCLHSVFRSQGDFEFEVFVVDNNSVDGSLKMVAERFPQVKRIANKTNLGFSKANNQAIKEAKGEYVLLLNPDTVVEEDTFDKCIRFMDAHPDGGGLGIKMVDGKGIFLPESKRGLPTPKVAFYKIFGLSALFPESKQFGQYHLGHLSKDENHEVEILSGAFMLLRASVLEQIGLLDESFFMYGEDIDLSYRITKAGYKNYYLSETSIIHYKGESTKKSSINYVLVFYKAMVIFAKKHFSQKNATLFSSLINFAIYVRAGAALIMRLIKRIALPALDILVLYPGMLLIKDYYETNFRYAAGGEYPEEVSTYGFPIMIAIYILSIFFSGAYNRPNRLYSITKGVLIGSLVSLIVYSLLNESYRFSRALVLLNTAWSTLAIPLVRLLLHWLNIYRLETERSPRVAIVGNQGELQRISSFLKDTLIEPEFIAYIRAQQQEEETAVSYTGDLYQLNDIIDIYRINEVIFCAKDLHSTTIIKEMSAIRDKRVDFKIAPPESLYIIGSNSIETTGDYYIIGANALLKPYNLRKKRWFDFLLSIPLILTAPLFMWFFKKPMNYWSNLFLILIGKYTFVGLRYPSPSTKELKLRAGILSPADLIEKELRENNMIEKLNYQYSRDYSIFFDLRIIFSSFSQLSRSIDKAKRLA